MEQNTNGYNGNSENNGSPDNKMNNGYNYGQPANENNGYNYGQPANENNGYNYGQPTNENNGYNYGQSSAENTGYQNGANSYNYNNGNYNQPPQQNSNSGFAVASLVLGILSLVLMCGINIFTGILGIIFGAIYLAKGQRERRTMATVGLVLSIVGIAIYIVIAIVVVAVMGTGMYDTILNELYMNGYY